MRINVDHYRVPCTGEGTYLCLRVKPAAVEEDWEFHYDGIDGFEYEPGYVYELEIEKETVENPPADGSSIIWKLVEVISKEAVDENTEFQLPLQNEGLAYVDSNDGCNLLYEWPIETDKETCDQLQSAQVATFRHSSPPGKLVPVKID